MASLVVSSGMVMLQNMRVYSVKKYPCKMDGKDSECIMFFAHFVSPNKQGANPKACCKVWPENVPAIDRLHLKDGAIVNMMAELDQCKNRDGRDEFLFIVRHMSYAKTADNHSTVGEEKKEVSEDTRADSSFFKTAQMLTAGFSVTRK